MKVCLLGTGIGAARAPFHDESFEFWSVPGIWNIQQETGRKFERIYEVHSAKTLTGLKIPAEKGGWMLENITHIHPSLKASFPDAEVMDMDGLIEKYGPYFTSSLAWMLAEAIEAGAKRIDIYGVTMSAYEEYGHQKPGCSHKIGWAEALGIKVNIDKGAELMSAPFIYGYEERPEILQSLEDEKRKVAQRANGIEDQINDLKATYHHMQGQREQIEWFENNFWSHSKAVK